MRIFLGMPNAIVIEILNALESATLSGIFLVSGIGIALVSEIVIVYVWVNGIGISCGNVILIFLGNEISTWIATSSVGDGD
jgi:hypothetical protein